MCATEKLDAVFEQFDKTLCDSKVMDEGKELNFEGNSILKYKNVEMKATQTPSSWCIDNRGTKERIFFLFQIVFLEKIVGNQITNSNTIPTIGTLKISSSK